MDRFPFWLPVIIKTFRSKCDNRFVYSIRQKWTRIACDQFPSRSARSTDRLPDKWTSRDCTNGVGSIPIHQSSVRRHFLTSVTIEGSVYNFPVQVILTQSQFKVPGKYTGLKDLISTLIKCNPVSSLIPDFPGFRNKSRCSSYQLLLHKVCPVSLCGIIDRRNLHICLTVTIIFC